MTVRMRTKVKRLKPKLRYDLWTVEEEIDSADELQNIYQARSDITEQEFAKARVAEEIRRVGDHEKRLARTRLRKMVAASFEQAGLGYQLDEHAVEHVEKMVEAGRGRDGGWEWTDNRDVPKVVRPPRGEAEAVHGNRDVPRARGVG